MMRMLKEYHHHICLILLITSTVVAAAEGFPSFDDFESKSVTGDTYLFEGTDLMLTCTLPDNEDLKPYTAHNISFSFQNINQSREAVCLSMSSIQVIDDKSALLTVHNVTLDAAGQYGCYVGYKHCESLEDIKGFKNVGFTAEDVKVEYSPRNVTNFRCVAYNWNDSMKCTWQHPVKYVDFLNINVSLGYTVSSNVPVAAYRCPDQTITECNFNYGHFDFAKYYEFEVNVTNIVKNTTASELFHVNTHQSVKPAPVVELKSEAVGDRCFVLSWQHSKEHRAKVYRISHQSVGVHNKFKVLVDNFTNTIYTTCGYHPYSHHNFSVDVFPASNFSGYWSDPVYTDVWTPMTAPDVGPNIINGSFTTSSCIRGFRNVTLMWREIEEFAKNGIIDLYLVKLGDQNLTNVTGNASLAVVELPCHSPSELTIFAHNKGGFSRVPSVLLIPPDTFSVPSSIMESFVVEISTNPSSSGQLNSVRTLWNVSEEDTENMDYTIFWCLGLPGQTCESQINWSKVPGTKTDHIIPISISDAQKHLFGISVTNTQTGITSGIFWTGCLFTRNPPRIQPASSMKAEGSVESVRVSWSPVQCSYQNQVMVTGFRVKWCEEPHCNETDQISYADVPAKESSYMVSPLKAEAKYKVTVQSVSYDRAGGEIQPWKVAHTTAKDSSNPFVIIGVVLGLIVVGFGAGLALLKCRNSKRRMDNLARNQIVKFENARYIPNDHSLPPTPTRNLLDSTPAAESQCKADQSHVPVVQLSQEEDICHSGESSFDGPSFNSRSRLIKPASKKECRKSCPQFTPKNAVNLNGTSMLKQSSEDFENADMTENVSLGYVQQKMMTSHSDEDQANVTDRQASWNSGSFAEGGSNLTNCEKVVECNDLTEASGSTSRINEGNDLQQMELINFHDNSVPTPSDSMRSYMQVAETSCNHSSDSQGQFVQRTPVIPTLNKISAPTNNIVLHAEQSKREDSAEKINTEGYSAIVDMEEPYITIETENPDGHEVVVTVAPTAPSVLGQDSRLMEAASVSDQTLDTNIESFSSDRSSSLSDKEEDQNSNGYLPHV